ncbi:MAG: helix-turn-helix domain-containing protein [Polyangiaceae bacterium]|jgi:cytoskeletal protein RodZ
MTQSHSTENRVGSANSRTADGVAVPRLRDADASSAAESVGVDTLGHYLRDHRGRRSMSIAELARITRIPSSSLEAIEADRFDELPGEVFVRGFLRAYAQAVGLLAPEVLARYTSSRRVAYVTPLPVQTPLQPAREGQGRRFGVAIAFVLLLILLSLALSIVLKPRGHDMPTELSRGDRVGLTIATG